MSFSIQIFLIILLLSLEMDCDIRKEMDDYSFIYLLVVSPVYVPHHQVPRVCSAVMLVEDIFFLTAKDCFENPTHNQVVKLFLLRKEEFSFANMIIYQYFVIKTNDLEEFVVLRKYGLKKPTGQTGRKVKTRSQTDVLSEPRVLLTFAKNPSFTHCYCLGWISHYGNYDILNSKFTASKVYATWLKGNNIFVQLEEGEGIVNVYGSPLLCEVRRGDKTIASAVIGIYTGGDKGKDSTKYGLITFRSFHRRRIGPLAQWAPGTNFSISKNLSRWTIWPVRPRKPTHSYHK